MKYKNLGNSGLQVAELALGTMTFGQAWGENWGCNKDDSLALFKHYVDNGGNFFDSANIYQNGESEIYLGEFVKGSRDQYIIGTKYSASMDSNNINSKGNHRKSLRLSLEQSLKNLQTDYIDVLWIHAWDLITPAEEMLRALADVVAQGKVLYLGVSNTPAWLISKFNTWANLRGLPGFIANQMEYNLVDRSGEAEFNGLLNEFSMSNLIWSPLASGLLTGKYNQSERGEFRIDSTKFVSVDERNLNLVHEVSALSEQAGLNSAQMALRWIMQKSARNIPILGARKLEQLRDNMLVLDCTLSDELMAKLDHISQPQAMYPYSRLYPKS